MTLRLGNWALLLLSCGLACTTASTYYDEQGREAFIIECGAAASITVCHDRAKEECPAGYTTLSERSGFNRKELRVRCLEPQ